MSVKDKLLSFLRSRRQSYISCFKGEAGKAVLEDLARFCRADQTTFHPDARVHAVLEGRREVYLRISQHLNLPAEQLIELYGRKDLINENS